MPGPRADNDERRSIGRAGTAIVLVVAALPALAPPPAPAQPPASHIASGAWELGFNAALVSREGSLTSTLALFTNRFWVRKGIPFGAGGAVAFSRVSDLDRVDLEALVAVYKQLTGTSAYGYIGIGGGVRQEWVGSFSQARYPVGIDVGFKALISPRAAVTVTYEFRRMLDDPVANFSEHRFVTGLSILFRNGRDKPR